MSIRSEIGARGGAVGWGTALEAGRSRVLFPIGSMGVSIDLILSAALRGRTIKFANSHRVLDVAALDKSISMV